MEFEIREDKIFSPLRLIITINGLEELRILYNLFMKGEGPQSKKLQNIAEELNEYEI